MDIEYLPRDKKIIAVVEGKREKEFFKLVEGDWKFIQEVGGRKIYLREGF